MIESSPTLMPVTTGSFHIFIHTGDVSGDLQGALLIAALHRMAAVRGYQLTLSAVGGERMAQAGATLVGNTVALSAIGIFESWPYVVSSLKLQRKTQQFLRAHPPDLVVLIDYMGPNIAIGNFIRKAFPQVPMAYYIAPQQWVWSLTANDTRRILAVADKLLAIFPEEARYYQKFGGNVAWVGHPLVDKFFAQTKDDQHEGVSRRTAARERLGLAAEERVITLLPASRQQELTYILPVMLEAARQVQAQMGAITFLLPVARPSFQPVLEKALMQYGLKGRCVAGDMNNDAIAAADVALTKSGTVNLEIALMDVPQVVMYRLNPVTAWIGYRLLRFSAAFVSPVNLVEMEAIVPEFVQSQATPEAIREVTLGLLRDPEQRQKMLAGYGRMRKALGEVGVCDRAANQILDMLPTEMH